MNRKMEEEVKVHGSWASPFSQRVIWALQLKHIPYNFIEENLTSKSPLLLHYNPLYKKIPVLVHAGNPICESALILEYIDHTWPENPLLPSDPYDRATARFWIKFIQDKEALIFRRIFTARVEEREQARKESLEVLRTIEERGLGDGEFFGGDEINMVDLVYGWIAVWMKVFEEVVDMNIMDGLEFPRLHAWAENFKAVAVINDNIPDHHQMVLHLRRRQQELLRSPPN